MKPTPYYEWLRQEYPHSERYHCRNAYSDDLGRVGMAQKPPDCWTIPVNRDAHEQVTNPKTAGYSLLWYNWEWAWLMKFWQAYEDYVKGLV